VRPQGIAYCASTDDVRAAVNFARDSGVPLALRSGGHSYGGWSTGSGLVLDVSRLAQVTVRGGTATVGAGARLIDVYAGLARHGAALPAGSCPTVGVAGLTLGGGIGVLSRAWGLTCDNLAGVDLVTADGEVVTADAAQEPDLFWACRGGGGGNVGVATSFRFRLRPAPRVTVWFLRWDWPGAADVLTGWQGWAATAPDALWSTCKLLTRPEEGTPTAQVGGTWLGDPARLDRHLDELVGAVGRRPARRRHTTYAFLDAMRVEAGCSDAPAVQCTTARTAFAGTSHLLGAALPAAGVREAVARVQQRQAMRRPRQAGVSFDVLGGAVARVAPTATAFPHRRALAACQYTVGWPATDRQDAVDRDLAWLHDFRAAMTPFAGDHAYVNYADPSLRGWQQAYYGANYPRLQAIKRQYDGDGLFTFPQAVSATG
jgi:FAD/FMN-containing dehydrogenase